MPGQCGRSVAGESSGPTRTQVHEEHSGADDVRNRVGVVDVDLTEQLHEPPDCKHQRNDKLERGYDQQRLGGA